MAFNPPINSSGIPMRVEGEYMVLHRKNIEIEVKIDQVSGEKKAKGQLFITTARMVFVCDKKCPSFFSFDIPFANIYNEKFEQPVFGANYLLLRVKSLFGLLPGDTTVKLKFISGGCGMFVEVFSILLQQIRERQQQGVEPTFIQDLVNGNLENRFSGFVDPNDPSVVFVSQPEVQSTNPEVEKYFEPMREHSEMQREPKIETFGTGQPLENNNIKFPGAGVQIGGSMSGKNWDVNPSNPSQSTESTTTYMSTDAYPSTTNIYHPDGSNQKITYPSFSNNQQQHQQEQSWQPNVSYYYGSNN